MKFRNILQYGITFALLIAIILHINLAELWGQIIHMDASLFLFATLLIVGQVFCLGLRWHDYLNYTKPVSSLPSSITMTIAGHFANIVFISSAGGIIAKSALAMRQGLGPSHAIFITFLDRFMTLCALLLLGTIGLPLLSKTLTPQVLSLLGMALSLIIVTLCALFLFLRSRFARDLILSSRDKTRFFLHLRNYMEDGLLMRKTALQSLAAQICFILSVYVLSLGVDHTGVHVSALEFMAIIPVLALLASLPISLGGWGVREGAFIYGLGFMGFSPESALLLSIQVGIVTMVAPTFIALPCLLSDSKGWLGTALAASNTKQIR